MAELMLRGQLTVPDTSKTKAVRKRADEIIGMAKEHPSQ